MNLLSLLPGGLLCFVLFVLFFAPITMFIFKSFKRRLDFIEISLISLTMSLVLVPFIAWILNLILPFNYLLVGITFIIPLGISLFLLLTGKVKIEKELFTFSKSSLIILFIVFAAFFLRAQSLSSFFYEFDPYWYGMVTEFLIEDGFNPMYNDLGYNPAGISSHRAVPLPHFLTSVWYLLLEGEVYNNLSNAYIMNLYPPILGALMVFLVYFLFKSEYGNYIAIAAAIMFMFMPHLLHRFIGGGADQFPWGIAYGLAAIVFLHFALNSKNRMMYIPFLVMLIGGILGSKAGMLPLMMGIAFIGLVAIKDFILKIQNRTYHELSLAIMGVVLFCELLFVYYRTGTFDLIDAMIDVEFFMASAVFAFTLFTYYFEEIKSKLKLPKMVYLDNRVIFTSILFVLGLIFLFTIGSPILDYASRLAQVGMIGESALMKTVAEENLASGNLSNNFGFMGVSLNISGFTRPILGIYGSLDALPLIYLSLIMGGIYGFFFRKSNLTLLVLLFILVISIIALQKVKFSSYLGLILALAFILVVGESYKFVKERINEGPVVYLEYYIGLGMIFFLGIIVLFALASYLVGFISSFGTNGGSIPHFALKTMEMQGLFIFILISGLSFALWKAIKEKTYEPIFASCLMILILPFALSMIEVVPYSIANLGIDGTNYTEVSDFCNSVNRDGAFVATRFYCPIIPQYWYDTMMFIRDETPKDTRMLSWWDYGHWTNFYGRRNTVTRNDHPAGGEENEVVADKFVANNEQALKNYMDLTGSQYVMFDQDLIGKWGALTYLSCVHNEETSSDELPAQSRCSAEHQFERIYIPLEPNMNERCMIQETFGVVGYSSFNDRGYCIIRDVQGTFIFNIQTHELIDAVPLNMGNTRINDVPYNENLMIYLPGSLHQAPGRGYNSIYYKAFFLGELDGFEQVYPAQKGMGLLPVRIYRKI